MKTSIPRNNSSRKSEKHFSEIKLINLLIAFILLTSCSKEGNIIKNDVTLNKPIRTRTCEAGSYTESNGRLIFDDQDEYLKTVEFLSCAGRNDVDTWLSGLETETAAKDYAEFASRCLNTDDEDMDDLVSEYEGKISISYDNDTANFKPLFKTLNEFCNRNGEFQIGSVVIKVTAHKIISILNPSSVSPSSINDATTTDTVNKVFVYFLTPCDISIDCCPNQQGSAIYYSSTPRQRSDARYAIYNASTVRPHPTLSGVFIFDPLILVDIYGQFRKKSCFLGIGCRWIVIMQEGSIGFSISFTHNFDIYGVENDITYEDNYSSEFTELEILKPYSNYYSSYAKGRMPELCVCVSEANVELINTSVDPDKTLIIDCD